MIYFRHMKEAEFDERFDRIESECRKASRTLPASSFLSSSLCAREFISISEDFTQVRKPLDDVEVKIEAFAHRVDFEAEERHSLAERVSKLEQPTASSASQ